MAALQDRRARLLASLYAEFGEPADWAPVDGGAAVSVTVRRRSEDGLVNYGGSTAIGLQNPIRVRRSEVAQPYEGDLVTVKDPDTGAELETYRILGEPRLAKTGAEWVCDAALVGKGG